MRWIPEIAALAAALAIALHTNMTWWQFALLWVAMDLMTATRRQLRQADKGR
ncbi:hypothetical protein LY622_13685 [Halomonas sp. M5N1S17]|uniref:hypothetical protein n=1 Tax=Halomonas alkalisoli TaxID=2907158 RepID=UPI001F1604A6|nr:hypothetical protein [Halomonas alkalisoli]MCE9664485.1 hypothetical protein [Halomonas alkalisoli]